MTTTAPTTTLTAARVWRAIGPAGFAVVAHTGPDGAPRCSGVMYGTRGGRLYASVERTSWKARQIADGDTVAVTVTVHRGGVLALVAPIPPATVTFRGRARWLYPGTAGIAAVPALLTRRLPTDPQRGQVLEVEPAGDFLCYGVDVPLRRMANPPAARARVPVG